MLLLRKVQMQFEVSIHIYECTIMNLLISIVLNYILKSKSYPIVLTFISKTFRLYSRRQYFVTFIHFFRHGKVEEAEKMLRCL